MNYDVYKSMDALEECQGRVDPEHFWAQLKYGELHYRLRALPKAEDETLKAAELAQNAWQSVNGAEAVARRSGRCGTRACGTSSGTSH